MTNNYIDITGLHLQQLADIVTELETGFMTIYGSDINLDPNSPDGQMINLFAQAKVDILDVISSVYNSFSPTSAIGSALDQRCAINGVSRKGASYTTVECVVTTIGAVALPGLDGAGTPFTVADISGNEFYLITGITTTNGANTLLFRAAIAGALLVTAHTITKIVTITLNVSSVDNTGSATYQGIDEETDTALRYRRSISVANPSTGYLDGLQGAILAITGVTFANVYENTASDPDGNSIPGHSIWVVVEGGANADIADAIYTRRNAGCGMYGDQSVYILQDNGYTLPIHFSRTAPTNLYIQLILTILTVGHTIDQAAIKTEIASKVIYDINQVADYSAIALIVKEFDPLAVIISGGVSNTSSGYTPILATATIASRWVITTGHIDIQVI